MTQMTESSPPIKARRDIRQLGLLLLLAIVLGVGYFLQQLPADNGSPLIQQKAPKEQHDFKRLPSTSVQTSNLEEQVWKAPVAWIDPANDPQGHKKQALDAEVKLRFDQAVLMLHAQRFDEAIIALERALTLRPNTPEAYVNIGFALLGKEDYRSAYQAFDQAIELNPAQANAYYGAAIALEGQGDLAAALGGMRSFLHLSQDKGPGQIHVARARSAIWEWEAKIGRGPWGPTKGIPPGFTAEELKRNDQGVGIKMPLPNTVDDNGAMQYEIKYQDKFELFDR
ncbi:MAG: tetratricopeptide repeat protein [Motiliproteus sp.]